MSLAFRHLRRGTSSAGLGREAVHLHEEDVACGICASVHNKGLLLDVSASAGPDRQLAAILTTQVTPND